MPPIPSLRTTLVMLSLAAGTCLLPLHDARAQLSVGGAGGGGGGGGDQNPEAAEAKAAAAANAPPPALPGAVPADPDAPSTHSATDLNPNAALFDAIDRGDLTAAKDALSRGADLQATNVLGQKPIEMSIDLNRNDITFLLLSMRADDTSSVQTASATAAPGTGGTGTDTLGHLSVHAHHGPADAAEPVSFAAVDVHGGTPKPEVGFLGFGGT